MIKPIDIKKGETIAVAVSGGKDSMCLLSLLFSGAKESGITVKAVNVDHSIRGKESENDSAFVKNYCEKSGIPLFYEKVDAIEYSEKNGLSLEEGARILRYGVYERAVKSGFCDKIATAHHESDNFETILFNLFRGTSVRGLTGISEKRGYIIRPLIRTEKREIDEYIEKNSVPFVEDGSNSDISYSRNFIRHKIVPLIKEKFPRAESAAARLAETLSKENEYLDKIAEKTLVSDEFGVKIPICADEVIFKRAVISGLKKLGVKKDFTKAQIDGVYSLARLENGSRADILKGVYAIKEYDNIALYNKEEKCEAVYPVKTGEFVFGNAVIKIEEASANDVADFKSGKYFAADDLPPAAVLRTRRNGDMLIKFDGTKKKLKEYFSDKKIPLKRRDETAVIADGNTVLAVIGYMIGGALKVTAESRKIYKVTEIYNGKDEQKR